MRHSFLAVAALALLLIASVPAQTVRTTYLESPPSGPFGHQTGAEIKTIDLPFPLLKIKQTGLLTSRLSDKDRERWKGIAEIALATHSDGTPLHPVFHELWRWAEACSHAIYVELVESKAVQSSTAGSFNLERFDPTGNRHEASLKLFLSNIDQAVIGPQVARANGFIPFSELRKEERYAEVLGHELAHVKYVLNNIVRAHLVHELIENTNEILLVQTRKRPAALVSPEMRQRLTQRDTLLRELELQAETIEEIIWRELIFSRKVRAIIAGQTLTRKR
ncbi:MAG TPA: hypothetical protein VFZ34_05000 [Blastocatellia bacterium]|nr:hypothetical protein [Blastocatellia bacterium]